ncbi:MAG: ABC transporter permease [Myxococcota bacterium]|nr:ABC transporter permease [Myxococcota bacterium]
MKSLPLPLVAAALPAVIACVAFLLVRARIDFARHEKTRAVLQGICASLGVLFLAFTYWTQRLPVLRGSAWTLRDALVRSAAIGTGVLFLVGTVVALLPWALDQLEGGAFSSYVAARHVRAKKSGFLTLISGLSIFAVALASFSLSSAISVMGGFSADLKRKILGNNAHIIVDQTSQAPWDDYAPLLDRIAAVPGVAAATPVVQSEVMASSSSNLAGVVVHGIDPQTIGKVIDLRKNIEAPFNVEDKLTYLENPEALRRIPADEIIGIGPGGEEYTKGPDLPPPDDDLDPLVRAAIDVAPLRPGLVIGRELAKTLHVYVGDEVTLVSPLGDLGPMGVMPKTRKYRIAGIFYSGMYEYDATHVYTTIEEAQSAFGAAGKITAIDVRVDDAENADRLDAAVVAAVARDDLRVRDWREMNKNLFSALKLERIATFLILSIEIIVASFCIVCTLLLMMTEKSKEIAILKALGASDGTILRTFMTEGIIIGGIGTLLGVSTAMALCTGLAWFGLRLDPDVYYIDRLPINVSGWDYAAVTVAALTICTIATLFPAKQAAKLRPVDGLRYE